MQEAPPSPDAADVRGGLSKAPPERRCVVHGDSAPRDLLIRFVLSPDGTLTPDLAEKLPGRGAYVTADPALISQAVTKKLFARSFKTPVQSPSDLQGMIAALLTERLTNQLGLAKKANLLALGEEAMAQALRHPKSTGAALWALDASPRTSAEYGQKAAHSGIPAQALPLTLSLIHISEPTRLLSISYAPV